MWNIFLEWNDYIPLGKDANKENLRTMVSDKRHNRNKRLVDNETARSIEQRT